MAHNRVKRHTRIRKKIYGTTARPRLSVFRSLHYIYAQIIDDDTSVTLVGMSDKALAKTKQLKKSEKAYELGKIVADLAKKKHITEVVFDRGGNKYHGRVAEFARGAREHGLIF